MADETQFEGKASARNRLVDLFAEARALITAGLEAEKPVRRKFKKKADFVREALSLLEGRVAGEIAEEEMDRRFNELLDRYSIKLTPPPAWLDPKWASAHIRWLKAADAQLPGSAREFLLWQQSELALPLGRRINKELDPVFREAARLRQKGYSWGEIRTKLCPNRSDPGHKCGRSCADRIRLGAGQFQV